VTELRLRPRTVSELVDAAFALYRQDATQYILVAAIGNAPLLILQLIMPAANPATPEQVLASVIPVFLLSIGSWITYALMSGVVVRLGSRYYLGEHPDLGATIAAVLPRVPSLMLASLIKGFFLFLGFLLFIVGVFYMIARYFSVSTVIVLEGQGPFSAFGRSANLSRDRKGHILLTLLLVYIIYFILSIGVTALAALSNSHVIQVVTASLYTIVAFPVIALTEMMLYYDARIRGEAFDLEQMAASLDAGSAAPAAGGATA
jgi:hypothetical protein